MMFDLGALSGVERTEEIGAQRDVFRGSHEVTPRSSNASFKARRA